MPIYEYRCVTCNKEFEKMVPMRERTSSQRCPVCNGESLFTVSAPRISLDGTDPGFPTAWDGWRKKRQQHMKAERKREDS